jgi:hypothetical protein
MKISSKKQFYHRQKTEMYINTGFLSFHMNEKNSNKGIDGVAGKMWRALQDMTKQPSSSSESYTGSSDVGNKSVLYVSNSRYGDKSVAQTHGIEKSDAVQSYPDSLFNYVDVFGFANKDHYSNGFFIKIDKSAEVDTIKQDFRLLKFGPINYNNEISGSIYDSLTGLPIAGAKAVIKRGLPSDTLMTYYNLEREGPNKDNLIPILPTIGDVADSAFTDSTGNFSKNIEQGYFVYDKVIFDDKNAFVEVSAPGYHTAVYTVPFQNKDPNVVQNNHFNAFLKPN